MAYDHSVFINCPFDEDFAPVLQGVVFVVALLGFRPRIATERSDSGETRLDKIRELIAESRWSIHDLSRCQAREAGEFFRLNMPFELGIDWGCRAFRADRADKRFLILEEQRYRFQAAISDISGCDIEVHGGNYERAMEKVRNWLKQTTGCRAPGPSAIRQAYVDFSEWEYEWRLSEGYSEDDIRAYPTFERLEAINEWIERGRPASFE